MYAHSYNCGKPNRNKLKKHHEQYLFQLLTQASGQLYDKYKKGINVNKAILFTNSVHLGEVLVCSPRTIRNYNKKLCNLGLIKKIYHGQSSDYEIIFNKFLFPLIDKNSEDLIWQGYESSEKALSFAKYIHESFMWKNMPSNKTIQKHFNKQLIGELHKNESNFLLKDYLILLNAFDYLGADMNVSNSVKELKIKKNPNEILEKNVSPASKAEQSQESPIKCNNEVLNRIQSEHMLKVLRNASIEEMPYVFAYILYDYSMSKIPCWKENVYPDAAGNTIIYLAENYFHNCNTREAFDKILEVYKKTIDFSSMIIRKKLYSGIWEKLWTFPMTYFSLNNKNGFPKAYKILKDKISKRQKLILNEQRIESNDKLNQILEQYYLKPDRFNYLSLLSLVRDTIPYREKQINYCIENKIKKIENYY